MARVTAVETVGKAYVANSNDNSVSIIDTANNTVVGTLQFANPTQDVVVNPDGNRLFVVNGSTVTVLDTTAHNVLGNIAVGTLPFHAAINSSGSRLYVANLASNNVS